jgi:cell division initiation protein
MPDQSSAATEHAILQEITRPLDRLPDDPMSIVNAEFPSALRGYDRVHVDEYVRQTRQLVAELQATRSPEAAVRRALERVGEQITGILKRAHETAEQITAQSRREAEDRLEQARQEARQIADAAERRVRDLDADTDRIWLERQRIVADAEDLAAQLHAVARTAAERFPEDAEPEPDLGLAGVGPEAPASAETDPDSAVAEGHIDSESEPASGPPLPFDGDMTAETEERPMYGVEDTEDGEFFAGAASSEPPQRSEVEQTMAFRPLAPHEHEEPPGFDDEPDTAEDVVGSEPVGPVRSSTGDPQGGLEPEADPDATTIIPPSSQAAHRRQDTEH